jgi:hypothetical protein
MNILQKFRGPFVTKIEYHMSFVVPSTSDAVVHENHDSGSYDNAV